MGGWLFGKATLLWSVGIFVLGIGAGGFLTAIFTLPAPQPSPPAPSVSLEEAHRLLDKGQVASLLQFLSLLVFVVDVQGSDEGYDTDDSK